MEEGEATLFRKWLKRLGVQKSEEQEKAHPVIQ
jgi:hypothetical protein